MSQVRMTVTLATDAELLARYTARALGTAGAAAESPTNSDGTTPKSVVIASADCPRNHTGIAGVERGGERDGPVPCADPPSANASRYAALVGCLLCGSGRWASGLVTCERCRRGMAPTPVQRALASAGMTIDELAEAANVSRRGAAMAVAGVRLGARLAARVSRVTGVPARVLMVDHPAPAGMRRKA